MEKTFKRTLVTTALPYANGPVHIGHLAGVYVPADIYTRFLRLRGEDVIMIGGSAKAGVPITRRVLSVSGGRTYITVEPQQTAASYSAGLRQKYVLALALSAAYILVYLLIWGVTLSWRRR